MKNPKGSAAVWVIVILVIVVVAGAAYWYWMQTPNMPTTEMPTAQQTTETQNQQQNTNTSQTSVQPNQAAPSQGNNTSQAPSSPSALSATPNSGAAPLSVSFTYKGTGDTLNYTKTSTYLNVPIDFGDNSLGTMTSPDGQPVCNSSDTCVVTITHTYAKAGTYTAKVTSISGTTVNTATVAVR